MKIAVCVKQVVSREWQLRVADSKTQAGVRRVPMAPIARAILTAAVSRKGVAGPYLFAS